VETNKENPTTEHETKPSTKRDGDEAIPENATTPKDETIAKTKLNNQTSTRIKSLSFLFFVVILSILFLSI